MIVKCPICGGEGETDIDLVEGQHVICAVCRRKFVYSAPQNETAGDEMCHPWTIKLSLSSMRNFLGDAVIVWLSQFRPSCMFKGVVGRREYWQFFIMQCAVVVILFNCIRAFRGEFDSLVLVCVNTAAVFMMAYLVLTMFSVVIKRYRDTGRSWVFFILYIIILELTNEMCKIGWIPLLAFLLLGCLNTNMNIDNNAKRRIRIKESVEVVVVIIISIIASFASISREVAKNVPFKNIGWKKIGGDNMTSQYVFTTDAPANTQCMAVYVMGKLTHVNIIESSDPEKGENAIKYIKAHYELEGSLSGKR